MGDFNLNLLNNNSNRIDDFMNLMLSFSLRATIFKPTRITNSSATLLDNIFTNSMDFINTGILVVDVSDHLPVFLFSPSSTYENKTLNMHVQYTKRCFDDSSLQNFFLKLSISEFDVISSNDVERIYNHFLGKFVQLYNECFPTKTYTIKKRNKKPWMTKELRKLCMKKK